MTCSIDGCGYPALCRGWCNAHYLRWQKYGDPLLGGKPRPRRPATIREMFEFYMPGEPPVEGIVWRWTGQTNGKGYGRMSFKRKRFVASRISYELFVGPIPRGLIVRHKNDNPIDVNPHNLELGTFADNTADMIERDRMAPVERTQHLGIDNGIAKLTDDQVREIRYRRNECGESATDIASEFGVTKQLVSIVARRKGWKHVA